MTNPTILTVDKAWIDDEGGACNVFAAHDAGDNHIETYGYVGSNKPGILYDFHDRTNAEALVVSTEFAGFIDPGRWAKFPA